MRSRAARSTVAFVSARMTTAATSVLARRRSSSSSTPPLVTFARCFMNAFAVSLPMTLAASVNAASIA